MTVDQRAAFLPPASAEVTTVDAEREQIARELVEDWRWLHRRIPDVAPTHPRSVGRSRLPARRAVRRLRRLVGSQLSGAIRLSSCESP
ncbi:MAG: hypothetical protein ACRDYA_05870 [Egibacteraceae bacterium]